jgi:putative DNA primase/helicase
MKPKPELEQDLAAAHAVMKHCLKSEAAPRIHAMIDLARSEEGIPILPGQMDRDAMLLNCPNGTLELRTGTLREHRREDYITKLCPVPYDATATCPRWEQFLQEIMAGRQDMVDFLQRLLGYALTGDVSEQILTILHGKGANGKTTLTNTILEMLGADYAMKAAPELLMVRRGEAHPTERADLFGKRLVLCLETDQGGRLAEALVKDLTGGDRQRARRMREDFWEFTPTHKLLLATNHKPMIQGTDHAVWRRVRLVPFTVTLGRDRQDKRLPEKLRQELPGILAWSVRGCLEWQRSGLGEPAAVVEATAGYRRELDALHSFLDECCHVGPHYRARAANLYGVYCCWCADNHEVPMSQRAFGMALTEREFERYTDNGVKYRGLAPRAEWLKKHEERQRNQRNQRNRVSG